MISALCTGRLVSNPATGTTKTEKPFARCTIACDVGGEADVMVVLFVMAIARGIGSECWQGVLREIERIGGGQ